MLCSLLLALGPALTSSAAHPDWPHFLGPARDGVSLETEWSSVGAPEPLWSRSVGLGYSCPSIVGERLVTMGYEAEAELDHVLCLDRTTGDELWVHSYPASDHPQYHGGGTLSTPSIADGLVYGVNRHGHAFALELESGALRWEREYREELELDATFHGYCASPVVLDERILFVLGGCAVMAQREDGAILWRTEDHGDGAYANPTVFELRGRPCAAVMLAQTFYVLDLEDGSVLHELPWELKGNAVHVAQPLVLGERVLLSSAYDKGAAMLRLGAAREPELLWSTRRLRNKVTGLYLHARHVFGFDESMLKCFDLEGQERWHLRGLGMGALSIAGERLLVLSSSGELIVAEASGEEYRELSRAQVLSGGSYWTMPVLVGGLIYVRNSLGDMACLDHRGAAGASAARSARAAPEGGGQAPAAAALFDAHARASAGQALRAAKGLRLKGEWEIVGRGMSRRSMTMHFAAPNRWQLALDSGNLLHSFDGELGYERKNGGYRLFDEAEAGDAPRVFALAELFAPSCPVGASVEARPVRFGGVDCWRVVSAPASSARVEGLPPAAAAAESAPPRLTHYFEVDGGRLVGREGDGLSTTIFRGALQVGEAQLPASIQIYRTGSGQEETLYLETGEWLEPEADLFERPAELLRLLRTPAQRATDGQALRERYARELGRYRATETPLGGDVIELRVENGDLLSDLDGDERILERTSEARPEFLIQGTGGARLSIEYDEAGAVRGVSMQLGPNAFFLPRID